MDDTDISHGRGRLGTGRRRKRFNPPLKRTSQDSQVSPPSQQLTIASMKQVDLQHIGLSPLPVELLEGSKQQFEQPARDTCRRPHTVLSYCEDSNLTPPDVSQLLDINPLHDSLDSHMDSQSGSFLKDSGCESKEECILPPEKDSFPMGDDNSEISQTEESEPDIPRCRFKVSKAKPTSYNFSILGKHPQQKDSTKKSSRKLKQVKIAIPKRKGYADNHGDSNLCVFEFKSTQEQLPTLEVNDTNLNETTTSKHNVTANGRSKEEQLAVEMEVLELIAKTRLDIKAIRARYAARKAGRIFRTNQGDMYQPVKLSFGSTRRNTSFMDIQVHNKERTYYDYLQRPVSRKVPTPLAKEE